MRLVRCADGDQVLLGRLEDDHVVPLLKQSDWPGADLLERFLSATGAWANGSPRRLSEVRLLAPCSRPGKIVCVGLNYLDHCRETGQEPPPVPVVFAKFPNCLAAPGEAVEVNAQLSSQVDFEVELAAVIGKTARNVAEAHALDHVLGYTVANDVSARDVQLEVTQWTRGKSFDGFLPLGPWIVTADEIGDPQRLRLRCSVNGITYQDSSTAEMIFTVARLISFLSMTMTLEPGDLLLTGTPWGVGMARQPPVYLHPGDEVVAEIEQIGVLTTPITRAPSAADIA